MKSRDEILMKKAQLAERIASQRARLAGHVDGLQPLLRLADKGMAAVRTVRAHPEIVAVAAGIVFALRPRRTIIWLRRGFVVWRSAKWAQRVIAAGLDRI